jgi:hypothetical protein
MLKKLGKTPARPGAISLKFGMIFNIPTLPTPPQTFGRAGTVKDWGMLANDQVGDCVLAGAAHETKLITKESSVEALFTDASVLADYTAITGYNPNDPSTDQGTDMQAAAAYRLKTGVLDASGKRHLVDAYMEPALGDLDEFMTGVYLMGFAGLGVRFPGRAEAQFDAGEPWTVVQGDTVVGGHYIPVIDRTASGNLVCVTWGREQEITPDWYRQYVDESVVYLSKENLSAKGISPENFDFGALDRFFEQLAA